MNKEFSRSEILKSHLLSFFEYQYQKITEEMWTDNYESINLRVAEIAKQIGSVQYSVVLYDKDGSCVFACSSPPEDGDCSRYSPIAIDWHLASTKPSLNFDGNGRFHNYESRLEIGGIRLGWLSAKFSDPYAFLVGDELWYFALKTFLPVALVSIIVWLGWVIFSRIHLVDPYLRSYAELRRKESLSLLASRVAHDIRSPIETLDLLIRSIELEPSRQRIVSKTIERIKDIANDLLQANRTVSGVMNNGAELDQAYFLNSLLHQIVSEKRMKIHRRSIDITLNIPDGTYLFTNVDRNGFARVLSNVIDNSIEAIDDYGWVSLSASQSGKRCIIRVSDSGRGIPPDLLDRLGTERFSTKSNGNGLGLLGVVARDIICFSSVPLVDDFLATARMNFG